MCNIPLNQNPESPPPPICQSSMLETQYFDYHLTFIYTYPRPIRHSLIFYLLLYILTSIHSILHSYTLSTPTSHSYTFFLLYFYPLLLYILILLSTYIHSRFTSTPSNILLRLLLLHFLILLSTPTL